VTVFRYIQKRSKDNLRFLALADDVMTLVRRSTKMLPPSKPLSMYKKRSAQAAFAGDDQGGACKRRRRNAQDDAGGAASSEGGSLRDGAVAEGSLHVWPLNGFLLSQLLGAQGGVKTSELQRAHVRLLGFLGLDSDPKPVYNLVALVCARLLPVLSKSLLEVYQQLRQRWQQENQRGGLSWGPQMNVTPWSSPTGPDPPKDCLDRYEVSLPSTAEQLREACSVDQRLALLAAALGVPALVVNADLTLEQCSNFHRIIEAIAPYLGVANNIKWPGVETVMSGRCGGITKTYLDLSVRTEQIFAGLIKMFVGSNDYLEHVFQQRGTDTLENKSLVEATGVVYTSIMQVVGDLTSVVPRASLRAVFDVAGAVKRLGHLAKAATNPVLVTGVTGSGKSTFLSALIALSGLGRDDNGDGWGAAAGSAAEACQDSMLKIAPFMVPSGMADVSIQGYTEFLRTQGTFAEKNASQAMPDIVDALFNPACRCDTTVSLPLLKLLTAGNPRASSTHISTRIVDGPGGDEVILHFHSIEEISGMICRNPDLQQAFGGQDDVIAAVAGRTITLRLPPTTTRLQRNGQLKAMFNTLHGVQEDPCPPFVLRYPELVRLVEFSCPLAAGATAYQDQIGELERNRLLQNAEDGEHMVRCVVISHFNASAQLALGNALNTADPFSKRRVLVLYNVANNPNSEAEIRKASTVLASQARTSVKAVQQEIEDAFPAFADNMNFVAFDPVSTAAMARVLQLPQVLGVKHLWRLPLALKQTGFAEFIHAQHRCIVEAAIEVEGPVHQLQQLLEQLEHWGETLPAQAPVIGDNFKTALRRLPSDKIAETALKLAVKHERIKATESLQETMIAAHQEIANAAAVDHFNVSEQLILQILQQMEAKVKQEIGSELDTYVSLATTRIDKQSSFVYLRKLTAFLEQQQLTLPSEEELVAKFRGVRLWDEMAEKLVYDTHTDATPFASFAHMLRTVALDVATLFVVGACHELSKQCIEITLAPLVPRNASGCSYTAPIETQLLTRIRVDGVVVDGRRLQGQELADHARVIVDMAKIVAFRVVEQQCISTLKIEAALEPTADMVCRSVLHHLRGRRDRLALVIKGASEEAAASKIFKMMKECLDRSFKGFTIQATLLHLVGANHPGAYVVDENIMQRYDGRDFLIAWLKNQIGGVLSKVDPFVKQVTSARKMLELYLQYARVILSNRRRGLVRPDEVHRPAFHRYDDTGAGSLEATFAALRNQITLETVGATSNHQMQIQAWAAATLHLEILAGWNRDFGSLRNAVAHLLDIHSASVTIEKMHEDFNEQRVTDVSAIMEYFRAKHEGGEQLTRFYEAYKDQHQTSVDKLVKTLMMAVAAITPADLAHAFNLKGRSVWRHYIPSSAMDLTVAACLDEAGRLKSQAELGVPDYVFECLSSTVDMSPTALRRVLEQLDVRGDDLCSCFFFELQVTAIVKQQAIALVVVDQDSSLQYHVFRPELCVTRLGIGTSDMETLSWSPGTDGVPIDVIAVFDGHCHILSGYYKDGHALPRELDLDALDLEVSEYDASELARIFEQDADFDSFFNDD